MENKSSKYYTRTVVKGVRAEKTLFDKLEKIAEKENTNKNELIVRILKDYIWQVENGGE